MKITLACSTVLALAPLCGLVPSSLAHAQGTRVSRPLLPGPGIPGNRIVSFQSVSQGSAVLFQDLQGTYRVPVAGGIVQAVPGGRPNLVPSQGQRYVWEFSTYVDGHTNWRDLNLVAAAEDGTGVPVVLWRSSPLTAEPSLLTLSPDGEWAVWRERPALRVGNLLSCRTDGTETPRVLAPGANPSELRVDPTSSRVLYRLGTALHSAPIDGTLAPVVLDASFSSGAFEVAPDGQRVVFLSSPTELSSRRTDGSDPEIRISAPVVAGGVILDFRIAPGGSSVIYRASALVAGRTELFRTSTDGSTPAVPLVPGLGPDADVEPDFALDDAGDFVVYRADALQDERFELFSVRADGSAGPLLVSGPLTAGGDVLDFKLAPVGRQLAYRANGEVLARIDLHGSALDGSLPAARVSEVAQPDADVQDDYLIAPGGTLVYFRQDRERDEAFQLLARRLSGAGPVRMLNGPLVPGGSVEPGFRCDLADARVVYRSDEEVNGRIELRSASLIAPLVRLSPDLTVGNPWADAAALTLAEGGARAVYLMDREHDGTQELHGARLDGPPDFVKLNGPLGSANDVLDLQATPDGGQVLFRSNEQQNLPHLFVAPADGSAPARRLSDLALPGEQGVEDHVPTRDGLRAVYRRIDDGALFGARLDVAAPALRLTPVLPSGWRLSSRPLGESLGRDQLYFSTGSATTSILHAARLDGSGSVQLATSPQFGSFLPREAPDGLRVGFTGPLLSSRVELFSVPADGSAPALRLSGPMSAAGGNVASDFAFTADSLHLVYRADADVDGVHELYVVRVDGSTAPRKLTAVTAPESVLDFQLTPDSRRAVFRTSLPAGSAALFAAPLDGSSPPVPLALATDPVGLYWLEPDSSHALFATQRERVDQLQAAEVWRARLDGTVPAFRIGPTIEPFGRGFAQGKLSPDGKRFAMTFQGGRSAHFELVVVELESLETRLVLPHLPWSGRVAEFAFTPDSRRLLYVADQEAPEVFEVFQSWLDRPLRRSP